MRLQPIAQEVRVLRGQSATLEQVVAAVKDVWDDAELEVAILVNQSAQWSAASMKGWFYGTYWFSFGLLRIAFAK